MRFSRCVSPYPGDALLLSTTGTCWSGCSKIFEVGATIIQKKWTGASDAQCAFTRRCAREVSQRRARNGRGPGGGCCRQCARQWGEVGSAEEAPAPRRWSTTQPRIAGPAMAHSASLSLTRTTPPPWGRRAPRGQPRGWRRRSGTFGGLRPSTPGTCTSPARPSR